MFRENEIIVFQGDSITDVDRLSQGDENGLGHGYACLVSEYLKAKESDKNIKVINRGISGNRITDLLARWKKDCINLNPDMISILIGVNDVWHEQSEKNGVDSELFEKIYDILLDETKKALPNVKIVLCEPFILNTGQPSSNYEVWEREIKLRIETVRKMSEKYDTKLVPLNQMFIDAKEKIPAEYLLFDGVHPTLDGHKMIRDKWLEIVK